MNMARTTLRSKGQLTVPDEIRKAARLEPGDPIEVELTEDGILLRPLKDIDPSQAWFWTPEWQAKEREADASIAAGRGRRFETGEELLAWLDE
jgi:AbrB family looped-hinge helix DNA binding protein